LIFALARRAMRLHVHATTTGVAQWINKLNSRIDAALNALLATLD
jgi:hypothetical protein